MDVAGRKAAKDLDEYACAALGRQSLVEGPFHTPEWPGLEQVPALGTRGKMGAMEVEETQTAAQLFCRTIGHDRRLAVQATAAATPRVQLADERGVRCKKSDQIDTEGSMAYRNGSPGTADASACKLAQGLRYACSRGSPLPAFPGAISYTLHANIRSSLGSRLHRELSSLKIVPIVT